MTALIGLDARMRMARLWWCTDARRREGDLAELAAAVLAGGVDVVQLADGRLDHGEEESALAGLRAAALPTQALVAAGGTPATAGRAHVDALSLGPTGSARAARRSLHRWAHIGRRVGTRAELDAALADPDIDYLVVCAVPDLDLVRYAAGAAPPSDLDAKPWWACAAGQDTVGAITIGAETIGAILAAGACRVMIGAALASAADPAAAAEALRGQVSRSWRTPAMRRYIAGAAAGASALVRR